MGYTAVGSNETILSLYNKMDNGTLTLQPYFQRELVWNNSHKENFIETILKGLPFPEVYFADGKIDLQTKTSEILVVDGQQRLSTIYEYISNSKDLILKKIPRFEQLNETEQTNFLDYPVVVRALGRISEDEIKSIFSRINSVQYALNAVEINNALYRGEFISTAKSIINSNFLSDLPPFAHAKLSRMEDLGFVLLVLSTIEVGGYFTQNNEVEKMIQTYDEEYPNKDRMVEAFKFVLNYVKELNIDPASIWWRRSCLFSLIVELLNYYLEKNKLKDKDSMKSILDSLETNISANKDNASTEYGEFYKFMLQGTASRQGRIARGTLIQNALK